MRTFHFTIMLFLLSLTAVYGQLVTLAPAGASGDDEIRVVFDASEGNGELVGASSVYMHSGIVTDAPDGTAWQYVVGNWGADDGVGKMTPVAGDPNKWEILLTPSARDYHKVDPGTDMFRLAMVFRNASGSLKATIASGTYSWGFVAGNGDVYVDLESGPYVNIVAPNTNQVYVETGSSFSIAATASAEVTSMKLYIQEGADFVEKAQVTSGQTISYAYTPSASGEVVVKVTALIGGVAVEKLFTVEVIMRTPTTTAALPVGIVKGINYHQQDPTKVTLVLEAPGKEFAYVVGDFTNWKPLDAYQMKVTPDGELFWLEIANLTPGKEYVFQYWVEGAIKIGDPYADKVVDPWNDKYIPAQVYPDPVPYDKTAYEMATVLQTDQVPYAWSASEDTWVRPQKETLVIYEVLIRDFLGSHSYKDLTDTLAYLKRLGVNAIELMPIMEFEGNDSWGYNPAYFFAPDKYYGSKNELKKFIETAHQEGMAVILDMVLNHAFGQNPMVKMYWDETNNTVSGISPWFNPVATHPYNVGYDFNHESTYTKNFVDSVNLYWLEEYHFDGFRFDLSKGFTQKNSGGDVTAWSEYDLSRIAILKRMADTIWSRKPGAYIILEHFAVNQEEKELAEYKAAEGNGMLLWGNMNHAYNQNTMGYESGSNLDWVWHGTRNWEVPHVVGYMESHDEERLVYKNITYGNSSGDYEVKDTVNAIFRGKAGGLLFYLLPGPKMMWQFGELGYDYSINWCTDGSIGDCRLVPKPPRWDYLEHSTRYSLFQHTADLLRLRNTYDVFTSGTATFYGGDNLVKQITIEDQSNTSNPSSAEEMNVVMAANFDVTAHDVMLKFPHTGTWYDYYLGGKEVVVEGTAHNIKLSAGKYKLFTDYPIENPIIAGVNTVIDADLSIYPNPAEDILHVASGKKEIEHLVLTTIGGNKIIPNRIDENQWEIRSLRPGFYIVQLKVAGKFYYGKIIKR